MTTETIFLNFIFLLFMGQALGIYIPRQLGDTPKQIARKMPAVFYYEI
jgi:hypothetical protein